VELYEQPMFISFTYRIAVLHYTYGCATLSSAYLCEVYLGNHWVTLQLWVSNLMSSLSPLALPTELLRYTKLISV